MDYKSLGEQVGIKWEDVPWTVSQFEKGVKAEMEEHHDDPETKVIDTQKESAKVAWAHLKEDPKYYDKLEEIEESIQIESLEDLQRLLDEATPESARDRLRRRPMAQRNTVKSHQDNETGHSKLSPPELRDRVQPKRERADRTQMQHRGKMGHRHSARTQKGKPQVRESVAIAIDFITENYGKPFSQWDKLLADIEDRAAVAIVAKRMMSKPGINRDWLQEVIKNV